MSEQKKQVIFVKSNLIDRDDRMRKETAALKQKGYSITLLSWDRDLQASENRQFKIKEYDEICLRLKAPWGINVLPLLPIWWCFVFYHMVIKKWDIAHVMNLDSIVFACIAGKFKRKPVIYEIVDTYEDIIMLPKMIRNVAIVIDKLFMRMVTAIILIDDNQLKEFGSIPNSRRATVYDSSPNLMVQTNIDDYKSEIFTIYYTGRFDKARRMNIDKIVAAIESIEHVRLVISGQGDQIKEIKNWASRMPAKITFLGFISHEEVMKWSYSANLLLVARTPSVISNIYNCGSTVLRALMFGKPFIANKGTATADLICKEHCGIAVDAYNINEIQEAIITLRDNPNLCQEFGQNAKTAYEQHYKWEIMEQRLFDLYENLLEIK